MQRNPDPPYATDFHALKRSQVLYIRVVFEPEAAARFGPLLRETYGLQESMRVGTFTRQAVERGGIRAGLLAWGQVASRAPRKTRSLDVCGNLNIWGSRCPSMKEEGSRKWFLAVFDGWCEQRRGMTSERLLPEVSGLGLNWKGGLSAHWIGKVESCGCGSRRPGICGRWRVSICAKTFCENTKQNRRIRMGCRRHPCL
jgi:hypothetical protein